MFKNDCNREFLYCLKKTITTKKSQVYPSGIFQNYEYISIPEIHVKGFISMLKSPDSNDHFFMNSGRKFLVSGGLLPWVYNLWEVSPAAPLPEGSLSAHTLSI